MDKRNKLTPKERKYNWKLRELRRKQTVSVRDFPIEIRIKPTAHSQYCFLCRNAIEKGGSEVVMESGMWHKYLGEGQDGCHSIHCNIKINQQEHSPQIFVQRRIYLHPDCYVCMMNKMLIKAGLGKFVSSVQCETCRNRFNCYTNNMEIDKWLDESWRVPAYVPSRASATGLSDGGDLII